VPIKPPDVRAREAEQTAAQSTGDLPSRTQGVVGGRMIGHSIVYHLALLGAPDVVLLERKQLTPWHAAGEIVSGSPTEDALWMARYSAELYAAAGEGDRAVDGSASAATSSGPQPRALAAGAGGNVLTKVVRTLRHVLRSALRTRLVAVPAGEFLTDIGALVSCAAEVGSAPSAEAAPGDRSQRQGHQRVEDAPQECGCHQRVVRCAAELEEHAYQDGVHDAEAAAGDRDDGSGPEGDGERGEGIGCGQFGAGHSDESQRGEQDQVREQEVGRDADRSQLPALVEEDECLAAQSGGLGGQLDDRLALEQGPDAVERSL
jgi:hypothetical protein